MAIARAMAKAIVAAMATAIANSNQSLGQRKEDHPSGQPTLPMQLGGEVYSTPWSGINSGVASTPKGLRLEAQGCCTRLPWDGGSLWFPTPTGLWPWGPRMRYNELGGTV